MRVPSLGLCVAAILSFAVAGCGGGDDLSEKDRTIITAASVIRGDGDATATLCRRLQELAADRETDVDAWQEAVDAGEANDAGIGVLAFTEAILDDVRSGDVNGAAETVGILDEICA